ncbi:MAG: hypothetical protein LBS81_01970 [Endomicrobium sp.]|nr:hypothetical protein [Endomicrobium sp.]
MKKNIWGTTYLSVRYPLIIQNGVKGVIRTWVDICKLKKCITVKIWK